MSARFDWKGEAIKAKIRRAAVEGINATMAKTVLHAKQNHDGWQNRTGTAERGMQVRQTAAQQGARIVGQWGVRGVNYIRPLEFLHGSALRNAAAAVYPQLAGEIRKRF